ncbi:MAG TPA: hypothetical protein VFC82_02285 [Actinomycetaceae bacterium]|nr:hypothetical protein [Actinomycetaceae bacterium]
MHIQTRRRAKKRTPLRALAMTVASAVLAAGGIAGGAGAAVADDTAVKVNIMLQGSTNGALDLRNGDVSYYENGWHDIDGTNVNNRRIAQAELAPGTYTFAVSYNGTREQKTATVTRNGQYVYFQAANVKVDIRDSYGQPLEGAASYYAGSWHSIDNSKGVEMLAGTYSFAATYNGTRQQVQYTVLPKNPNNKANAMQTVGFKTTRVGVVLQGQGGPSLSIPADGSASYYAGGWHEITTVNTNNRNTVVAEMLPGTYPFAATYNGTRQQKNVTISGSGATVWFQLALVNTALTVDGGDAVVPASSSYYATKWYNFGAEGTYMLPGTYSFAIVNDGARQQQSFTVLQPNSNNWANGKQTFTFVR